MPNLALFDFDDTLVRGDTILYFRAAMFKRHRPLMLFQPLQFILIAGAAFKLVPAHVLKRFLLWPWAFFPENKKESFLRDFAQWVWNTKRKEESIQKLHGHQKVQDKVVIISASYHEYLQAFQPFFPNTEILGTEMTWKGWLKFPQYGKFGNLKGKNKIKLLKHQGILNSVSNETTDHRNYSKIFAYSDSHSDIPMMEFANIKVGVSPTRRLIRYLNQFEENEIILKKSKRKRIYDPVSKAVSLVTGVSRKIN